MNAVELMGNKAVGFLQFYQNVHSPESSVSWSYAQTGEINTPEMIEYIYTAGSLLSRQYVKEMQIGNLNRLFMNFIDYDYSTPTEERDADYEYFVVREIDVQKQEKGKLYKFHIAGTIEDFIKGCPVDLYYDNTYEVHP